MISALLVFVLLIMLVLALFFKDNLGTVFFTDKNFIAGVFSVSMISLSYVIMFFPTPLKVLNELLSIFNVVPFILALVGGKFFLFLGLLMETIVLFFVIRVFLYTKKDLNKK